MKTISFKVSDDVAARLRARARQAGAKSLSAYLRSVLEHSLSAFVPAEFEEESKTPPKRVYEIHPISGLKVDVTPGMPDLTVEDIKRLRDM